MNSRTRKLFDLQMDQVLAAMPEQVHRLLDEIPLFVEDYPSLQIMQKTGVHDRRQLCGLYTGVPLGQRSLELSGILSDVVHIYREGILEMARDPFGNIDPDELRRQIRITVLHELGHHHGLTETQLQELGY